MFRFLGNLFLFILLTVITQVGGVIYVLSLAINAIAMPKKSIIRLATFPLLYLLFTYLLIPFIAPFFGRQPITTSDNLQPAHFITALLNRNYVTPELNQLLVETSSTVHVNYLEANFPFIDGFPLLPHLSHKDGKKVDVSFSYKTKEGEPSKLVKSRSGYGIFEAPFANEPNQPRECKEQGYWQYSFSKFLTFGSANPFLDFDAKHTRNLVLTLANQALTEKIFLEPHLIHRMKLQHEKIKFHGCHSVRHDDHIHLQIR